MLLSFFVWDFRMKCWMSKYFIKLNLISFLKAEANTSLLFYKQGISSKTFSGLGQSNQYSNQYI